MALDRSRFVCFQAAHFRPVRVESKHLECAHSGTGMAIRAEDLEPFRTHRASNDVTVVQHPSWAIRLPHSIGKPSGCFIWGFQAGK